MNCTHQDKAFHRKEVLIVMLTLWHGRSFTISRRSLKNYNHDHTSLQYSVFDDKVVFTLFKKDKQIQFFSNHTKCSQHIDFLNCLIAVLISLLIMISGISNLRKIQNEKVHEKFTFLKK